MVPRKFCWFKTRLSHIFNYTFLELNFNTTNYKKNSSNFKKKLEKLRIVLKLKKKKFLKFGGKKVIFSLSKFWG